MHREKTCSKSPDFFLFMAPHDSSDSDSEGPETFTLSQTKGAAQKRNAALRELEAAEKRKKKVKNQERDRKLKKQAEASKKRKVEAEESDDDEESEADAENDAEARMLRAMRQADEEVSDEEEGDESGEGEEGEEGMLEDGNDVEMDEDEEELEESSDEDMETTASSSKPNHLPDHLFASAFSSKPTQKPSSSSISKSSQKSKKTRRKRTGNFPRDLIIGSVSIYQACFSNCSNRHISSRAVRTLPQIDKAPRATAAMLPSAKVQKFLDRSLSVRGNKSATRGWERRAGVCAIYCCFPVSDVCYSANIGSMRRQGPAAHFVRAS